MTKDETLDWLYRLRSEILVYMPRPWLIPMGNALDVAIKALEKECWIPCSERMPEDNEEVLVTYGDRVIISRYMGVGYGFICGLVDAWMPLPQPWKGQKE